MEWGQWITLASAGLLGALGLAVLSAGWILSSRAAAVIVVAGICLFVATTVAIRQYFIELGWSRTELAWLPAILIALAFGFFATTLPPILWEIARARARNLWKIVKGGS